MATAVADAVFVDLTAEETVDLTSSPEAMPQAERHGESGTAAPDVASVLLTNTMDSAPRAGEGGGGRDARSTSSWVPLGPCGGWRHASMGDEWHGELCQDMPHGKGVYAFADSQLRISGSISGATYDRLVFSGQGTMEWPGLSESMLHMQPRGCPRVCACRLQVFCCFTTVASVVAAVCGAVCRLS